MKKLTYFRFYLWFFGKYKVPMIGYLNPKLIKINDKDVILKIKFNRRSKNHLNSMYFGALSVGADLAGGLHSFYHVHKKNLKASIVFKSFSAKFLKRPQNDVYFICHMGEVVKDMITKAETSHERINKNIQILAYTNYFTASDEINNNCEQIGEFTLELSIKITK